MRRTKTWPVPGIRHGAEIQTRGDEASYARPHAHETKAARGNEAWQAKVKTAKSPSIRKAADKCEIPINK
jgi:hypothetical protein